MDFFKELKISLPTAEELLDAVLASENGEELTDRQLWILENFAVAGDCE